jgi:hypothetical protein
MPAPSAVGWMILPVKLPLASGIGERFEHLLWRRVDQARESQIAAHARPAFLFST